MATDAIEKLIDLSTKDQSHLVETINKGMAYQAHGWLDETSVQSLLKEVDALNASGSFAPSGLSNSAKAKSAGQGFGKQDRAVCPVDWWASSLHNDPAGDTEDTGGLDHVATIVGPRLQALRTGLSQLLTRPTLADASLAHECYYSRSSPGAFLRRHLDERHEELKGSKGWLLSSRRSISWLVYLTDKEWSPQVNGGALRTYPQMQVPSVATGCHQDNLQIGWLHTAADAHPVFLDASVPSHSGASSALYTVVPQVCRILLLSYPIRIAPSSHLYMLQNIFLALHFSCHRLISFSPSSSSYAS
jgi:hypothetical protein